MAQNEFADATILCWREKIALLRRALDVPIYNNSGDITESSNVLIREAIVRLENCVAQLQEKGHGSS